MRMDNRKGVAFCPLSSTGCKTLVEAHEKGWKAIFDNGSYYEEAANANMVWVYDADYMITIKDRHAKTGRIEPISEVTTPAQYKVVNDGKLPALRPLYGEV